MRYSITLSIAVLSAFVISIAFAMLACSSSGPEAGELLARGQKLYKNGRDREAAVQFQKAAEGDEGSWDARYWLALSQLKSNMIVGASGSFLSAIELLAGGTPVEGKIDKKAREAFEKGKVFLKSHRDDEAIRQFKKAIDVSPEYADPYYDMAFLYGGKDDFEEFFRFKVLTNFCRFHDIDKYQADKFFMSVCSLRLDPKFGELLA